MDEKQATPKAELFRRLSDSSYPKTELEHFAWGLYWDCAEDNTKLRAENDALKGCETCAYWSKPGCLKCKPGFPEVGKVCRAYEREPGVEG